MVLPEVPAHQRLPVLYLSGDDPPFQELGDLAPAADRNIACSSADRVHHPIHPSPRWRHFTGRGQTGHDPPFFYFSRFVIFLTPVYFRQKNYKKEEEVKKQRLETCPFTYCY